MATAVSTIIDNALKRINILQIGQSADGDQQTDAFTFLNIMLDGWATERSTMPFIAVTQFTIVSTKGTPTNPYTVGVGGDANVARPVWIDRVTYTDNSQSPPLERQLYKLTDDAYQSLPLKTLTNTLPGSWYYQPTYSGNLGSLYLWMIATQSNLQGNIYAPSAIATFTDPNQTVVLPPGYQFAIQENLAVLLAATYRENIPTDPKLLESAATTKLNIRRANMGTFNDLWLDPMWSGRRSGVYDINSDNYGSGSGKF
jgi:hypothetical protein